MPIVFWLLLLAVDSVLGVAIDNGLVRAPTVECGAGSVRIGFSTQNGFHGRVYVKGASKDDRCRRRGDGLKNEIGIELPFEHCNLARIRSLSPRGVYVTTTVVISFHPYFLTKIDRAYRLQCLYLEVDKPVMAQLGVKDPLNSPHVLTPPMPSCHYEILENGRPVTFATIGSQVYHRWSCDSGYKNTYCMLVHSCIVDDGTGDKIQILDDQGCAVDKFVLGNLEYPDDLTAGREAHVYKYADREMLFFECRISVSLKDKSAGCQRPKCAEPTDFGSSLASKSNPRDMRKRSVQDNTLDVRAELHAIDLSYSTEMTHKVLKTPEESEMPSSHSKKPIFVPAEIAIPTVLLFMVVCLLVAIYNRFDY